MVRLGDLCGLITPKQQEAAVYKSQVAGQLPPVQNTQFEGNPTLSPMYERMACVRLHSNRRYKYRPRFNIDFSDPILTGQAAEVY